MAQHKNFSVQSKNGNFSSWKHEKWFNDFEKAIQFSDQNLKQHRGKVGTEWWKTRIAVIFGDEYGRTIWKRVYPPQKPSPIENH